MAASKISRLAVEDPTIRPQLTSYELPYLSLAQNDRVSEDLPFGSRGGIAVRHYFPLDGEYSIKIRLVGYAFFTGKHSDAAKNLYCQADGCGVSHRR